MENPAEIASRLLRFEQQLKAYQKLHEDELAELWRSLNECKQIVATLCQEIENRPPPLSQSQPTLDA